MHTIGVSQASTPFSIQIRTIISCVCNHGCSFLSHYVSPELVACDSSEATFSRWLPTANETQGEGRLYYGGL